LPSQAAFAKKAASPQESDYSFFVTRRDHRELHRAALDVEDSVRRVPLRKDDLFVSVVPNSHPGTEFPAENCRTETESTFTRHSNLTPNQIKKLASDGNRTHQGPTRLDVQN
jgi:hypothetical protein